jgi:hypothetical protein
MATVSRSTTVTSGVPLVKTVPRTTLITIVVIFSIVLLILLIIAVVMFFLYRKTLANLQNNIQPVCRAQ